jgi:hypothetical protein
MTRRSFPKTFGKSGFFVPPEGNDFVTERLEDIDRGMQLLAVSRRVTARATGDIEILTRREPHFATHASFAAARKVRMLWQSVLQISQALFNDIGYASFIDNPEVPAVGT